MRFLSAECLTHVHQPDHLEVFGGLRLVSVGVRAEPLSGEHGRAEGSALPPPGPALTNFVADTHNNLPARVVAADKLEVDTHAALAEQHDLVAGNVGVGARPFVLPLVQHEQGSWSKCVGGTRPDTALNVVKRK